MKRPNGIFRHFDFFFMDFVCTALIFLPISTILYGDCVADG